MHFALLIPQSSLAKEGLSLTILQLAAALMVSAMLSLTPKKVQDKNMFHVIFTYSNFYVTNISIFPIKSSKKYSINIFHVISNYVNCVIHITLFPPV